MRRIKVTFDLGGTWRLITTIQVSKSLSISKAKAAAIDAAKDRMAELKMGVGAAGIVNTFAEVIQ